jgi:hypothetical protein
VSMGMVMDSRIKAIQDYLEAEQKLRAEMVLVNRHSFTSQIGEWLVETIYEGERASSGIQAGWDVQAAGKNIQVKTHAKAINNNSNFTAISSSSKEHIDELIILNFSPEFKLLEFYKLTWEEAQKHIKFSGKKSPREELNWSSIKQHRIDLDSLPHQEVVSFFR